MSPSKKGSDVSQRYIALLRAINVGGRQVKMAELRALFTALHYTNVETFIASGNVIFNGTANDDEATHRQRIEHRLSTTLGFEVPTFLRTPAEIADAILHAPFQVPETEPTHTVHVTFLHAPLLAHVFVSIRRQETAMDTFAIRGRELYWYCRGKVTDSLVKWPKMERAMNGPMTMRNIKTIMRLAAKYPA